MKNIIIISLCLLSGVFSQAQTVAINTSSSAPDTKMRGLTTSTSFTSMSGKEIATLNYSSFENKTITAIQKSNVKPSGNNWFVRMSKWFSYNYQEMRESVNQWLYLEMNEDSYGWGAY